MGGDEGEQRRIPGSENSATAPKRVDGGEGRHRGGKEGGSAETIYGGELGLLDAHNRRGGARNSVADQGYFLKAPKPLRIPRLDFDITKTTNHRKETTPRITGEKQVEEQITGETD
jgi:hypothetical protein